MKKLLTAICAFYFLLNGDASAQTVIVNPNGSHSVVIDNGSTSTIVNPDGTHSVAIHHGSTSTIVNPNGTHSTAIHHGGTSTIVNPNGSHSTIINHGTTSTLIKPDGKRITWMPSGNLGHLAIAFQHLSMPFFTAFLMEFLQTNTASKPLPAHLLMESND